MVTHQAADGHLARVRVPGGVLTPDQLDALVDATAACGPGALELTSRANVQVRGLVHPARFAERLAEAGLLPSRTHERVRNIIASPYAHPDGPDVWAIARSVDRLLCATPELAELPGRFLCTIDAGLGDVAGLRADVGLVGTGPNSLALTLAETDTGLRLPVTHAPLAVVLAARAFLAERAAQDASSWRLVELHDGPKRVAARTAAALGGRAERVPPEALPGAGLPTHVFVGRPTIGGGTRTIGVPLGRLTAAQVSTLAAASRAAGEIRMTPWRTLVLPGLGESRWTSELSRVGFITEPGDPLAGVSACVGSPGCAKSWADVRADAEQVMRERTLPVHWSGCARRCGKPRGRVLEVLADEDGYQLDVPGAPTRVGLDVTEVAAALEAVRRMR